MKIERIQITVRDLIKDYEEKGLDGIEGVVAYDGLLDVRPPYQREFVYAPKERDEVIRTVKKGFPINTMYWAKTPDGRFELMDGQQRTVSICRYAAERERSFSVDEKYFFNLESNLQEAIEEYTMDIYVCEGTPSEIHDWFKVINIAGKPLTPQELRNTAYTGPWLSDAKLHFSKPTCVAYNMAKEYMMGSPIRQEYLETAISWVYKRDGLNSIEEYMAIHQHDSNASQLWIYFKRVIEWVQTVFPVKRREMKGIDWGLLYNDYKDAVLDPIALEKRVVSLMMDDDVTNKKGIYEYLLTGKEKYLSIRGFTDSQKRQAFEKQKGVCPACGETFEIHEMHGDHITPWVRGGKTSVDNCQMLCADCNRKKSSI